MSNEQKHTVATDALYTLGTKLNGQEAGRDAIHLAVIKMTAAKSMQPGQRCDVRGRYAMPAANEGDGVGIVDPFLDYNGVEEGDEFWLVILPRTITTLRHVWSHAAFPEEAAAPTDTSVTDNTSRKWVTDYAARINLSFDDLMDGADAYIAHNEYLNHGDKLDGVYTVDEFWFHYCHLRGIEVPADKQDNFFSCAC